MPSRNTDQRLDEFAWTAELYRRDLLARTAVAIEPLKTYYKGLDLKPEREATLLAALDDVAENIDMRNPEAPAFVAASRTFFTCLANGNTVGTWDELCAVGFLECLGSGFPAGLCAVAFFACLALCADGSSPGASTDGTPGSAPPAGFLPFKGCRGFYKNTTGQAQKITVTIYNPGPGGMDIRLQNANDTLDGDLIDIIEEGEYKTITVSVPPGKRLHGQTDGHRRIDRVH